MHSSTQNMKDESDILGSLLLIAVLGLVGIRDHYFLWVMGASREIRTDLENSQKPAKSLGEHHSWEQGRPTFIGQFQSARRGQTAIHDAHATMKPNNWTCLPHNCLLVYTMFDNCFACLELSPTWKLLISCLLCHTQLPLFRPCPRARGGDLRNKNLPEGLVPGSLVHLMGAWYSTLLLAHHCFFN